MNGILDRFHDPFVPFSTSVLELSTVKPVNSI
jgi:hypothetical protein